MKKALTLIKIARIMPEWMYGREFLVKVAVMYAMVHAMSAANRSVLYA